MSALSPGALWLLLGFSVAVFGPVPVPGFGAVNLSLFDLAVPTIAAWGFWAGWLQKPSPGLVVTCGAVILAIAFHSIGLAVFGDVASPAALLKESVKLIAVAVLFGLLCLLLSDTRYQAPAPTGVGGPFLLLLAAIAILAPTERYQDFHAMLGATATGLGILWVLSLHRDEGWWLTLIPLLCAGAATWLASKTYIVVALALLGACLVDRVPKRQAPRSTVGLAVIAALIFATAFGGFELLRNGLSGPSKPGSPHAAIETAVPGVALTSVESSGARRLDLWREGLAAGLNRFPVGIGLGQFNAVVASRMSDSYRRSTSPHNTPLTLFIEMGVVGLALFGTAAVAAWRAIRGFPPAIAVMVILLIGPSAALHDVQGMRILLLLIALGLARRAAACGRPAMADLRKSPS